MYNTENSKKKIKQKQIYKYFELTKFTFDIRKKVKNNRNSELLNIFIVFSFDLIL